MICPYCGQDNATTKEHFFPQSVKNNDFDFYACWHCNHLKRSHIVYPHSDLFKALPSELDRKKFQNLWTLSGYNKYSLLVPYRRMREIFDGSKSYYSEFEFSLEEEKFYEFSRLREIILFASGLQERDKNIRALILSDMSCTIYLLHTYNVEFPTPYKEMRSMNFWKFIDSEITGLRVVGDGSDGLWRTTTAKHDYFNTLLKLGGR